jgi:hypothetical protein
VLQDEEPLLAVEELLFFVVEEQPMLVVKE